jgi:hypothetical protein
MGLIREAPTLLACKRVNLDHQATLFGDQRCASKGGKPASPPPIITCLSGVRFKITKTMATYGCEHVGWLPIATFPNDLQKCDLSQNWKEEREQQRMAVSGRKDVTSFFDDLEP